MSASDFVRLRQDYPSAELSTQLLTIHADTYVVRAVVRLDSATSASGMAADSVIEVAEDRAYQRALEHLGIAPGAAPPETTPETTVESSPQTPPKRAAKPIFASDSPPIPASPQPPQPVEAVFTPVSLQPAEPEQAEYERSEPDPSTASATPAPPAPADPPAAEPFQPQLPEHSPAPVDLSDIIVQTDVELKRLGWGVNQGREFLERTYGKRSRHDLTDEELLEFLLYLESQPTPS